MKKIILLSMCLGLSFQVVNAQDKTTGSSTSSTTSSTDVKAKVESLYQQAYSKYKSGSYDAALSMISEAEGLLKAQNSSDVRFGKLRDEIYAAQKAKASTTTGGSTTGSTSGTSASGTASGADTKYKLDAMYQEAASKLKASNPDAALQIIYNAEAIMKNTGVTDPRFAKLKSDAVDMQKRKNTSGSGNTGTTGSSTTGSSTTGSNTTGSSTSGTTGATDVKSKVESLYQQAYSKYKAGSFDAALLMIKDAEALLKANNLTDARFAKLRDDIAAAQKAKSGTTTGGTTTGGSTTGSSTTGSSTTGSSTTGTDVKSKLDAYYNDAFKLYQNKKYTDALTIISTAEQLMKTSGTTDKRFADLKAAIDKEK